MTAEIPGALAGYTQALDLDRLIPIWVKNLQSSRRSERSAAIDGLTAFVCSRVVALAAYIDHKAADGQPLLRASADKVTKAIQRAMFTNQLELAGEREFYERTAAVIRTWLIARLEKLAPCVPARVATNEELTKTRLDWWCEFHCEAGKLPLHLRTVHDMMYYAHLTLERARAILGKPSDELRKETDTAVRLLRPLFDKARGKT